MGDLYSGSPGLSAGTGLWQPPTGLWGGNYGLSGPVSPQSVFGTALAANWDLQSTPLHKDFIGTHAAVGDSVALVFDNALWGGQSLASVIAAQTELVTNGDFSNGTTGWAPADASATISVVNGELVVTSAGAGAFPRAKQTVSGLVVGKMYVLTATARRGTTSSSAYITAGPTLDSSTSSPTGSVISRFFLATSTSMDMSLGILSGGATGTAVFDNVSLKLVPGTHFYQSSAGSQPKLASYPRCGVRNLLLSTATLSTQSVTVTAVAHTLSFKGTGTVTLSGASTAGPLVGTGAGNRVSLTFTPTAGSLTLTVSGSVTEAQLETGSTATAYQTVTTAYSVTQAPYAQAYALVADGVDDFMVSPTLDLSSYNRVAIYTAVRKLSDAAVATVLEFSSNPGTNTGTFNLRAPDSGSSYGMLSKGSLPGFSNTGTLYPAPNTAVLTVIGGIATDVAILRADGTSFQPYSDDQGTGNYGNYPLYLFMRGGSSLPFKGAWYGATIPVGITPSASQNAWAEQSFNNLCRQA